MPWPFVPRQNQGNLQDTTQELFALQHLALLLAVLVGARRCPALETQTSGGRCCYHRPAPAGRAASTRWRAVAVALLLGQEDMVGTCLQDATQLIHRSLHSSLALCICKPPLAGASSRGHSRHWEVSVAVLGASRQQPLKRC